jgi:hypothetical protein
MKIFYLFYFFTIFVYIDIKCYTFDFKNIFIREQETEKDNILNLPTFKYSIKEKLDQFYKKEIQIYISIIDPSLVNYVEVKDKNKESYRDNYEKFLGPTNSFFPNQKNLSKVKFNPVIEKVNKSSDNFTQNNSTNSNSSEILLKILKNEINDTDQYLIQDITYIFMRNIINPTCELTEDLAWTKFYDLNILLESENNSNNYTEICYENLLKHFKNSNLKNKFIPQNIPILKLNTSIENFMNKNNDDNNKFLQNNFLTFPNIKSKIKYRKKLNSLLHSKIFIREEYKLNLNLKNHMLESDINLINRNLEKVIKELLYINMNLDSTITGGSGNNTNSNSNFNDENLFFNQRFKILEEKLTDFVNLLDSYNISSTKPASGLYYLIIILLLILTAYLILKTIRELKLSYEKKLI